MQNLSRDLSGTLDVDKILDIFYSACTHIIGFEYVMASFVYPEQNIIKAVGGIGITKNHIKFAHQPLDSKDIMADIIRTGKTEIITGWDERFNKELYDIEKHKKWNRIFTPITLNNKNIGLVEAGFFHEERSHIKESQVHKMGSMGTLAGGIAHDFNNILAAIHGYAELLQISTTLKGKNKKFVNRIIIASNRAKDLIAQILAFSKQKEKELKALRLSKIVDEVLHLLRASIPANIKIHQEIEDQNTLILADTSQIHQVLVNLCTNAAFAMKEKGGTLTITINKIIIESEAEQIEYPFLTYGTYVKLSIKDAGCGIDKEILDRIFEPYFTTKNKAEGTGLGLAVVHGIIESHNGKINVKSVVGKETTFDLYFPMVNEQEENIDFVPIQNLRKGNETILFVDDEESLVEINRNLLELLGYSVFGFTSCKEAGFTITLIDPVEQCTSKTIPVAFYDSK